jgi:hypothetical protein
VKEPYLRAPAPELDERLAPVDLGLLAGGVGLGHEGLTHTADLAPAGVHVLAHRDLGHPGPVLGHEPLPDAPRAVTLLGRRLEVLDQPPVNDRVVGAERRGPTIRRALARRRRRRLQRLAHRAPVNAVAAGQLAHRDALHVAIATDQLE